MDALCITKLDILDELDEIKVCVGYEAEGQQVTDFPASLDFLEQCKPVYKTFPGWKSNTFALRQVGDLPMNARKYIAFLEEFMQVPVAMISTSPERDDTVIYPSFDTIC